MSLSSLHSVRHFRLNGLQPGNISHSFISPQTRDDKKKEKKQDLTKQNKNNYSKVYGYSCSKSNLPHRYGTHMPYSVTCHPAEVTFPPLPQPKLVLD